jgi:hypothetical protein
MMAANPKTTSDPKAPAPSLVKKSALKYGFSGTAEERREAIRRLAEEHRETLRRLGK